MAGFSATRLGDLKIRITSFDLLRCVNSREANLPRLAANIQWRPRGELEKSYTREVDFDSAFLGRLRSVPQLDFRPGLPNNLGLTKVTLQET